MTKLQGPVSRSDQPVTHPSRPVEQRTPPRRRLWPWMLLVLMAAGVVVGLYYYFNHQSGAGDAAQGGVGAGVGAGAVGRAGAGGAGNAANRAFPVVSAVARKGDMNLFLTGLGSVTPFNTVTVRSRVDGTIDKVNFKEGQVVKEGDLLFEIDPRPYQVQLDTAQGQMTRDQAVLHNAQLNVTRDTEAKDAISAQQLSTDSAAAEQAGAAIKIDQASIDSARLQLTYAKITAPISGRIGLRLIDQGNMVHATDSSGLAVITQLQPISVIFSLPEDNLQRVQKRMSGGELPVEAFDRDLTSKLSDGSLSAMDNQIDVNSGTFRLKAAFANEDNSLFPNQFVNARLLVETRKAVIVVPSAAVQRSPESTFVYVVKDEPAAAGEAGGASPNGGGSSGANGGSGGGDGGGNGSGGGNGGKHGSVDVRKVEVGPTEGDFTAITDGLAAGDIVVTDGVDKLQPGAKVAYSTRSDAGAATQPAGSGGGMSGAAGGTHRQHKRDASGTDSTSRPTP